MATPIGREGAIGTGSGTACALTPSGGVACWGDNGFGQLGNGTTENSVTPVGVSGLSKDVHAIAVGSNYACALTNGGGVKCWGDNSLGELGSGTTRPFSSTPVTVSGLASGARAISATGFDGNGLDGMCAMTRTGARCWGEDVLAQILNGTRPFTSSTLTSLTYIGRSVGGQKTFTSTPVGMPSLGTAIQTVVAGNVYACAVTSADRVECWGEDLLGQLGNGRTEAFSSRPVAVSGLRGVRAVAAGYDFACALTGAGRVECWGDDRLGQLGSGRAKAFSPTPVAVSTLSGVRAITAGYDFACALTGDGSVKCWGDASYGRLVGRPEPRPVAVPGAQRDVRSIAADSSDGDYVCALTRGSRATCWGNTRFAPATKAKNPNLSPPAPA